MGAGAAVRALLPLLCLLTACVSVVNRRPPDKASIPPACSTGWAALDRVYIDFLLTDRARGQTTYKLPWTDTLPPRRVTDARVCQRAAKIWHGLSRSFASDTSMRAYVVRAGGLYFVQGWPMLEHGNPLLVLDRKFRTVVTYAWLD